MRRLIATMTVRAGTTASGPPAKAMTGRAVTTMARFRSPDRQTRLRNFKGGAALSPWLLTARIAALMDIGSISVPSRGYLRRRPDQRTWSAQLRAGGMIVSQVLRIISLSALPTQ